MSEDLTELEDDTPPSIGDNSVKAAGIAAEQLRSLVDRIENIEDQIGELKDDVKEIYAEAKSNGFDVKTLRGVVRLRKKRKEERDAELAMTELYMHALGML